MSRNLLPLAVFATLLAGAASAEVPRVAVDIAPVHSLVARVMGDLGTPDLIIPSGASPHEYNLRPSEAAALQDADLVIWMGEELAPWMQDAIGTLAEDAVVTTLLETDGTILLDFREGALFEAHEDEHDGEDDDHADGDEHALGGHDPHAWLSPENAATWITVIAARLSEADPENASTYLENAANARADLDRLASEVNGILDPVRGGSFIVFHDAYHYFETAFDFPASGAISISDASDPSPARIAEIQARVADGNITCVLSEPQFAPGLVATVMSGTGARTAVLDPLGSELEPGAGFYDEMMRSLAQALADCMS